LGSRHRIPFPALISVVSFALLFSLLALSTGALPAGAASGWEQQTSGTSANLMSVSAASTTTAWAVGEGGTILKTIDGGATWQKQLSGSSITIVDVCAVSETTAWAAGSTTTSPPTSIIARTTNGGSAWDIKWTSSTSGVMAIAAASASAAWACGYYLYDSSVNPPIYKGGIINTADGGDNWALQYSSTQNGTMVSDISCTSSSNVWATLRTVGIDQQNVLRTTNGGANWSAISTTIYPSRISAIDSSTAWICNDYCEASLTTDGGATWNNVLKLVRGFTPEYTWDFTAANAATAWLISEFPDDPSNYTLYGTKDAGNNWTIQKTGARAIRLGAFDANNAWAVGFGGEILHTSDGGGAGMPLMSLESVTPDSGAAGSEIVLKGKNFGANRGDSYVAFWDQSGYPYKWVKVTEYIPWSDTEIRCKVPAVPPQKSSFVVQTYRMSKPVSFTVTLNPPPVVSAINPKSGVNTTRYAVEVLGSNFQTTSKVRLQKGTTVINGEGVVLAAPGRLTCYLDLKSKPLGKYDVIVTNPDNAEGKLTGGFTITNVCGQGAGASISVLAGLLGLLSAAGLGWRRMLSKD
jgi:photosystem II stability/assembly factor-like uncharacterized protein